MRVVSCHIENFASYKTLDFNFDAQGLTLIQGPTGSGKSTLCDAIPWVSFGRTAKDGAVDDVISWNTDGTTYGRIIVEAGHKIIEITRTRKPNDLYYSLGDGILHRGKDLVDTQKLINNLLGMDCNMYLAGAYFHEFSQTAQFFTTTAKIRRGICEQLVDLSFAANLQKSLAIAKKELTAELERQTLEVRLLNARVQAISRDTGYKEKSNNFEADKTAKLQMLQKNADSIKAKIKPTEYFTQATEDINNAEGVLGDGICTKCGAKTHSKEHQTLATLRAELQAERRQNKMMIDTYANIIAQIGEEQARENTYDLLLTKQQADLQEAKYALDGWKGKQDSTRNDLGDTELLLEVVNNLRSVTIVNTIKQLEIRTNKLLTDHFDAEIRVIFDVADADKLDVTIFKDGNTCSYTQLSKGQRQLLKLTFGISVMKSVSNYSGISHNAIFLDEFLDGLDDRFKVKAYGLLKTLELSYGSIFVVEHSEALKSLFEKSYTIQLINGASIING